MSDKKPRQRLTVGDKLAKLDAVITRLEQKTAALYATRRAMVSEHKEKAQRILDELDKVD